MTFITLIENIIEDILSRLFGGKGASQQVPPAPSLSPQERAYNNTLNGDRDVSLTRGRDHGGQEIDRGR